jgi:hypothetical protein
MPRAAWRTCARWISPARVRRPDGDQRDLRIRQGSGKIGRRLKPTGATHLAQKFEEAIFVDVGRSSIQPTDDAAVDVDAGNAMTLRGEADAGHQPDIAAAEHRDPHALAASGRRNRR